MTRLMKDIADAEIDEKNSFSDYFKSEKRLLDETNPTSAQISSVELRKGEIVNKKGSGTGLRFTKELSSYDQIEKCLLVINYPIDLQQDL